MKAVVSTPNFLLSALASLTRMAALPFRRPAKGKSHDFVTGTP